MIGDQRFQKDRHLSSRVMCLETGKGQGFRNAENECSERWRGGGMGELKSRIRCYSVTPSLQVLHFGAFGPKRTPATQASWPMRQVRVGWLGVIGLLFRLNITNHLASKLATWKIGCS